MFALLSMLSPHSTQQGHGGPDARAGLLNLDPCFLARSCITFQSVPKTTVDTESHCSLEFLTWGHAHTLKGTRVRKLGWKNDFVFTASSLQPSTSFNYD